MTWYEYALFCLAGGLLATALALYVAGKDEDRG